MARVHRPPDSPAALYRFHATVKQAFKMRGNSGSAWLFTVLPDAVFSDRHDKLFRLFVAAMEIAARCRLSSVLSAVFVPRAYRDDPKAAPFGLLRHPISLVSQ